MKKLQISLLLLFFTTIMWAQNDTIGWGTLDYKVPESPAFNLLGNQPNNILEPTSVRSIVVSIGNYFLSSGSAVIPKNIGVEIAPLLLSPSVTLNDYIKTPFLYRMRISAASNILSNGTYQIAEGLRFTLIDKSDPRTDKVFMSKLYESCTSMSEAVQKAIHKYRKEHPHEACPSYKSSDTTGCSKTITKMAQGYMNNNDSINIRRAQRKKDLWNATIWELGIAAMQQSPDSLISRAKLSKVGLWSTYGTGFGKNDQLLIGCSFGMVDSLHAWYPKLSVGSRYYYGKNELRAFAQAEYTHINNLNTVTASTGIVFNVTNGVWGQFTLNFIIDFKGNVSFVPGFNIGLGTAEKKSL